jgi:hypothetical protein
MGLSGRGLAACKRVGCGWLREGRGACAFSVVGAVACGVAGAEEREGAEGGCGGWIRVDTGAVGGRDFAVL